MALGAGAAVVMKVVSDIRQNQTDRRKAREKGISPDSFEVVLPSHKIAGEQPRFPAWRLAEYLAGDNPKRALFGFGEEGGDPGQAPDHWATSLSADVAMKTLPGIATYMVLDRVFKNREKKELEESIKNIKSDYSSLLVRDIERQRSFGEDKNKKSASADAVEHLIDRIVQRKYAEAPLPDERRGLKVAAKKDELKLFYFEGRKAGISARTEEEARKKKNIQSGKLISTEPDNEKVATSTADAILGAPILLALLAGIATHRHSLNRERDVDNYYNNIGKRNAKPPTRVKLVTAPKTVMPADKEPTAAEEEKADDKAGKKAANLIGTGLLGLKALEMAKDGGPSGVAVELANKEKEELLAQEEEERQLARSTPIDRVDANTVILNTPSGQIVIDATDPESMEYLRNNQEAIMDSLNSVNA